MDQKGRNKQRRNPWQYVSHVWLYTVLFQALKGERLSSVFSPDGTLNPLPHRGIEPASVTRHSDAPPTGSHPNRGLCLVAFWLIEYGQSSLVGCVDSSGFVACGHCRCLWFMPSDFVVYCNCSPTLWIMSCDFCGLLTLLT